MADVVSPFQVLHQLPQKPLKLGDLVSLAFRIFRLNWRSITARLFWPSLLASISVCLIQVGLLNLVQALRTSGAWSTNDSITMSLGGIVLCVSQWMLAMRATALFREVFRLDTNFVQAMSYARRKKWSVFTIYSTGCMVPFFVMFLCGVGLAISMFLYGLGGPAALAIIPVSFVNGFLIAIATAILLLATTLLFSVVSAEEINLYKVIERALDLTFAYPLRGGSYMCLLAVTLVLVLVAFGVFVIPFEVWEGYMVTKTGVVESPLYLRILETAYQTINNIISMAVAIIASGLYYRDVQFRLEGADMIDALQRLSIDPDR